MECADGSSRALTAPSVLARNGNCLFKHNLATPPTPHATHYVAATRMMDLID